jgi:hypothetical protein
MKASELRIGNLVYYRKEAYNVVLIAEDLIKVDIGYGAVQRFEKNPIISPNIDELKPIPLTEEWLLKFGFEQMDLHRFNLEISILSTDRGMYFQTTIINYVHQLQNLYFALTGNELNLK